MRKVIPLLLITILGGAIYYYQKKTSGAINLDIASGSGTIEALKVSPELW